MEKDKEQPMRSPPSSHVTSSSSSPPYLFPLHPLPFLRDAYTTPSRTLYRETSERAQRLNPTRPSVEYAHVTTTTLSNQEQLLQDLDQGRDPFTHYKRTSREKSVDSPERYLEDLLSIQEMGLPISHLSSRIEILRKYGPLITQLLRGHPITYHPSINSRLLMAFAKYFGISVFYVQNTRVILSYVYPLFEFREGDIISLLPN